MSWKKNAISYIMWFLYVLITEALVLICADELGQRFGLSVYVSALLGFGYAALVGLLVWLIRRVLAKNSSESVNRKVLWVIIEAFLCVALLAVGIMLRISNMGAMTQSAAYFETARVTYGQSIPQVVHGAVYLYLQVLHGLFVLVGNHFVAGIWLQIVLQMLAFVILYFVVRKMAGAIAAFITLGFGMCAPFFVQKALTLSPEMLYFLLAVLVLAVFLTGGNRKKLYPVLFLLFGALAGVMTYLDIVGVLLFLFAASIPFCIREEQVGIGRKLAALGCAIVSYVGVFAGAILVDALCSGKIFSNVLNAWAELYAYKLHQNAVVAFSTEDIVLIGLLVVGIFAFWCHKREETISLSVWSIAVMLVAMDFFTEEMPAELYCYLLLVVSAGAFVGQVFKPRTVIVSDAVEVYEESPEIEVERSDLIAVPVEEVVVEPQVQESVSVEVSQEPEPKPAIQFIENPLPLPKKHEKRVLDYAVDLTEETAEFDIDVADDDDFDK